MEEMNLSPQNEGQSGVVDHNAQTETVQAAERVEKVAEVSETPANDLEQKGQSADENAKYAAARREAESKARALEEKLKRLEQTANKYGLPDVDAFADALETQLQQAEEERRREELESLGIDPYSYEEYVSKDPRVLEAQRLIQQQQDKERRDRENMEFLTYFRETHGRNFDGTQDVISDEVANLVTSGMPLLAAYKAVDENRFLKKQLEDYKRQLEAGETNKRNAETSTGSVLAQAPSDSNFIDFKTFEANKSNPDWMKKNLNKILESRPKWR